MAGRAFVDSELAHCTLAKAWKLAVTSGVPADSVVSVRFRGQVAPAYQFTVAGHPELSRSVELACCRVRPDRGR